MSTNKTLPTVIPVTDLLNTIEPEQRKKDGFELLEIMKEISGEEPVMWGNSLIGFGQYLYKYESGREGDFFLSGYSPRKTALSIYIMAGFSQYEHLLAKLGKHKIGKGCLYVKKLDDIDRSVLKTLIKSSIETIRVKYPD